MTDDEQVQAEVARMHQERQMRRTAEEVRAMRRGEAVSGGIGVAIDEKALHVTIAINNNQVTIQLSAHQARDLRRLLNEQFGDKIERMAAEADAMMSDDAQLDIERLTEQARRTVAQRQQPA